MTHFSLVFVYFLLIFSPVKTFGSEEVDLNARLHGNWTVDNAKGRLHQFFQKERINPDYKFSQVGPDHNRFSFEAPSHSL